MRNARVGRPGYTTGVGGSLAGLAQQELQMLQEQIEKKTDPIVAQQAESILALISAGQYEEITPSEDGSLFARTSNILIEHND